MNWRYIAVKFIDGAKYTKQDLTREEALHYCSDGRADRAYIKLEFPEYPIVAAFSYGINLEA
jgi:hypothetical protein